MYIHVLTFFYNSLKLTLSESPLLIKNAYLEKPASFNGTYQTIGKSQGTPRSHCFTTCSNSLKKTIAARERPFNYSFIYPAIQSDQRRVNVLNILTYYPYIFYENIDT